MKTHDEEIGPETAAAPPPRIEEVRRTAVVASQPAGERPSGPGAGPSEPGKTPGRRRAFLIFFFVLLIVAAAGIIYWLHERQFESTDDAQVEAHLNPSARASTAPSRRFTWKTTRW